MRRTTPPNPSRSDLEKARRVFEKKEPRDLFYRAATELVRLSLEGKVELSPAEAVAVLLKTWNVTFYRFRKFDPSHFESLEHIVSGRLAELRRLRTDRIEALPDDRQEEMQNLFTEFEELLGPVATAKASST